MALISERMSREEIERALNQMKDRLKQSEIGNAQITCSIGVIPLRKYTLWRECTDTRTGFSMRQKRMEKTSLSSDIAAGIL